MRPLSSRLPATPLQAASQAAHATRLALAATAPQPPSRIQLNLHGDAIEEEAPLPLLALCCRLVEVLNQDARWAGKLHFLFDRPAAARAWGDTHAAERCARYAVLSGDASHHLSAMGESGVLVLVAPSNRLRSSRTGDTRTEPDQGKLELVQRLVCGAGPERPVILANPDLEALLVTKRIGRAAVRPMFLSDFQHAYFLAEAPAKVGHVSAVRRVWGHDWEIYSVEDVDGDAQTGSGSRQGESQRARRSGEPPRPRGTRAAAGAVALERVALVHRCTQKPSAAEQLAAGVHRQRLRGFPRRGVPSVPVDAAWAAEGGWMDD